MKPLIEKKEMFGWKNCYSISTEMLELVATADVGPRIVYFGFKNGKNLLKVIESQAGRIGDLNWNLYGGHRVWAAPEDPYFSYLPDNSIVRVEINPTEDLIKLTTPADESNLERNLYLRIDNNDTVIIRNEIVNRGVVPIRTASWGITSFAPGGVGIIPLEIQSEEEKRFQACQSINLWEYTNLADPSYEWHKKFLLAHQPLCKSKQKIGIYLKNPKLAYLLDENLIIKSSRGGQDDPEHYPDRGSNSEVYFDQDMLELEFLSSWKRLLPGEAVSHEETLEITKIDDKEKLFPIIEERLIG